MKKFLIAQLAFSLVFGSFVLAIIWPAEGWPNVAGVSIWLLNLLAMFTIAMVAGMVHSVRTGVGAKRDDALTALRKFTTELGKHSKLRKAWGWLQTFAMIIVAAFAGFTVSALIHGVLCFLVWLGKHAAEAAVTEADAATPVHTVEDDFQHFLSYSGLGAVHPEVIELMRMAYKHGADRTTC